MWAFFLAVKYTVLYCVLFHCFSLENSDDFFPPVGVPIINSSNFMQKKTCWDAIQLFGFY